MSEHRPELPAELDEVIARALAKAPEQRYSSCRELARAALAVTVDEASRLLAEAASRAASGRSDLSEAEAELAGKVIGLQLAREQARALSATPTPSRLAAQGVCPFKGLASFEPADADYFFGRERLIAELVARLVGASFLGIVGPSGSGKSSVLRAGLLPALAGGVLPGSERWRRVLIRPGERPLDELRRMLASGATDPVAEALDRADRRRADPARGRPARGAVHRLRRTRRSAPRSSTLLARAAADPQGRAVVVVAVRADFYGRFAAFPAARRAARHQPRARRADAGVRAAPGGRAARQPGRASRRAGARRRARRRRGGRAGRAAAALHRAARALAEAAGQRAHGWPPIASPGGVHGAVARLAEGTYARIPDEHKPLVRAIMLRLVGEGEGDAAVRRRAPLAELDLERNREVESVLATLADSRLVTVSEGSVEVAHEALLREWPRLREWIEEDGQGRRLRRHITQAATEWDAAGATRASSTAAPASPPPSTGAPTTPSSSTSSSAPSSPRAARPPRRRPSASAAPTGVSAACSPASRVLLAAAIAGGIFAVVQRGEARDAADEARDAETAQLAQRLGAQALVEEDLDRSLLLARQAVAIDDTPQTRGYLLAGLLALAGGDRDHARRRGSTTSGRSPSARTGGRSPSADSAPRRCASSTRRRTSRSASRPGTGRPGASSTSRDSRTAPTAAHSLFGDAGSAYLRLIDTRDARAARRDQH